ncbi:MAG TPA: hypothetical protein VHG34_05510 [Nitrososphaeraceae archaeon]|nr:hypothetical protein [Nitrososphaeraceae archaeon]
MAPPPRSSPSFNVLLYVDFSTKLTISFTYPETQSKDLPSLAVADVVVVAADSDDNAVFFSFVCSSSSKIPLPFIMNFNPFHSKGLCDAVTTTPEPYYLASLNTMGVGATSKLYTSISCSIKLAETV